MNTMYPMYPGDYFLEKSHTGEVVAYGLVLSEYLVQQKKCATIQVGSREVAIRYIPEALDFVHDDNIPPDILKLLLEARDRFDSQETS